MFISGSFLFKVPFCLSPKLKSFPLMNKYINKNWTVIVFKLQFSVRINFLYEGKKHCSTRPNRAIYMQGKIPYCLHCHCSNIALNFISQQHLGYLAADKECKNNVSLWGKLSNFCHLCDSYISIFVIQLYFFSLISHISVGLT